MKKYLLVLSVMVLLAVGCNKQSAMQLTDQTSSDQKLAITYPKGGEVWKIGTSQTITWASSQESQSKNKLVKITIIGERQQGCVKEGGEIVCDKLNSYEIVKSVTNTGSQAITLSSDIKPGKYIVNVWTYSSVGAVGGDLDETKTRVEITN